jgi:RNA exonuclease 1
MVSWQVLGFCQLEMYIFPGEKTRIYHCCSRSVSDGEGCTHGPHVFYESKVEDLHARYPFSPLQPSADTSTGLDVAAIDCEMIYTTGGMRVARVSVVDGSGKEVYDQMVRMDPGVEVMYVAYPLNQFIILTSKVTISPASRV